MGHLYMRFGQSVQSFQNHPSCQQKGGQIRGSNGSKIININNYKTARYIYNISFFNSFLFLKIDLLKKGNIFVRLNFLQFLNYKLLKISFLSSYEIRTKLHDLYYSARNSDLYEKKNFERFRTKISTV